ncbi:MAG: GNAT family N-acetyltransferase [Dehalococcoidia bacterium]
MLVGLKVVLREKRLGDSENDYAWRCDRDLARLDAAPPLKPAYREFMAHYAEELRYPSKRRRRFAIDSLDGKHIGNCMYYDIDVDKKQAELGILIGDREYWGKGYGSDALTTLLGHIFRDTNIDRIHLKTLDWNSRAQLCFEKCGFIPCGRVTNNGSEFIVMELLRSWAKSTARKTSEPDSQTSALTSTS